MVLACQTESHVLGMDCQCGSPRSAAYPINSAPTRTPAPTDSAGHAEAAPPSAARSRPNTTLKILATVRTTARANSAVAAFPGIPTAPNGMIVSPTIP